MNKERRKKIDQLIGTLQQAAEEIRALSEEEDEAFNNMPEGLQQGDKGQACETARDALNEAADEADNIVSQLEEARDAG